MQPLHTFGFSGILPAGTTGKWFLYLEAFLILAEISSTQHSLSQHTQHHVNQSHHLLQQRVLWLLGFMTRLLTFITLLCSTIISPHKAYQVSHFLSFCVLGNSTDMNKVSVFPTWQVIVQQLLCQCGLTRISCFVWLASNSIYKERDALPGGVGIARL